MGRHPFDPTVTVKHLEGGDYVVASVCDPRGRLAPWIKAGSEMTAVEVSEFMREWGDDAVVEAAPPAQRRAA